MKSFQMKALALATLGLGGLVMADGTMAATCPDPTANTNQGYATPNGPWSAEVVTNATIASGSPGLASTNCKMVVAFSGPVPIPGNNISAVQDQSPNNEQRYRARFYVDLSGLSGSFSDGSQQVRLFNALANQSPTGSSPAEVTVFLIGGSGGSPIAFRFTVADGGLNGGTGGFKNITVVAPSPAGVNRIEFDYNAYPGSTQQSACESGSANGSFCAWVTDGSTASTETSPTAKYNLSGNSYDPNGNTGWSGVKIANLGIFSPSPGLQTSSAATQSIAFDEFDSRRQTFIGQ